MNILLTSAGRRTYMVYYFRDALQGIGKIYASNSVLTYTLTQADGYVITPSIYNKDYVPFLLKYCEQENISVIIPLFDIDLPILSKNKCLFQEKGIKVIVSDIEVVEICNDKWATYRFLSHIGLPQARSFIDLDLAKSSIRKNEIGYPLIIKPRWGMGSIGIYKVFNESELDILYKKLRREIFNTYLKYESNADPLSCVIIQEMLKGEEYGLEILNDLTGSYVTTFAKRKIAMRSGETDMAEIVDAIDFESVSAIVAKNLKHIGMLDIDCIKVDNQKYVILEMNCRFGGQYPFSHNAGVNVPQQIVEWLYGEKTNFKWLSPKMHVISCKDLHPVIMPLQKY